MAKKKRRKLNLGGEGVDIALPPNEATDFVDKANIIKNDLKKALIRFFEKELGHEETSKKYEEYTVSLKRYSGVTDSILRTLNRIIFQYDWDGRYARYMKCITLTSDNTYESYNVGIEDILIIVDFLTNKYKEDSEKASSKEYMDVKILQNKLNQLIFNTLHELLGRFKDSYADGEIIVRSWTSTRIVIIVERVDGNKETFEFRKYTRSDLDNNSAETTMAAFHSICKVLGAICANNDLRFFIEENVRNEERERIKLFGLDLLNGNASKEVISRMKYLGEYNPDEKMKCEDFVEEEGVTDNEELNEIPVCEEVNTNTTEPVNNDIHEFLSLFRDDATIGKIRKYFPLF